MKNMKYSLIDRIPEISEYRLLCEAVGWGRIMNFTAAASALEQSVTGVVALNENSEVIGMGRIVGDGAIYFYLQDLVVVPEYQKCGIGTAILNRLLDYITSKAPERSFIGLFSVPEAIDFYRKFSFEQRDLTGLFTVKELIVPVNSQDIQ